MTLITPAPPAPETEPPAPEAPESADSATVPARAAGAAAPPRTTVPVRRARAEGRQALAETTASAPPPSPTGAPIRAWLPQPNPPRWATRAALAVPSDPIADTPPPVDAAAEILPAGAGTGEPVHPVWGRRGIWLGLLAIAIGGVGEALLFVDAWRIAGAGALGLAMVLGVVAWSGQAEQPFLAPAGAARPWPLAWRRALWLRLAGIAAALGLAGAALAAYGAAPDAIFGLQGWLWVASMGLLLLACARWYPRAGGDAGLGPAWTRGEAAVFLGLVALALATHVAFLDAIPWRFHFDEGYAYIETMRYYQGPLIPVFTTTWFNTSLPSFWFVVAAGLMHLTGVGLAGVRLSVALAGALLVIPVYGIARLAWGRLAAALAGFAVAVSAAAIHYSRVSILNITTAGWWAVCFYFLLRGLRSRRPGDFVWAGLAAGTSMYTYYGTRLLPYLLLAFIAYLCICHFRAARDRLGHFALLGAGFIAGFGPLLGYFLQHPAMWTSRATQFLNVPASIPTTWDALVQDWNILAPLAWLDFLGFSVQPGRDTVYYAPLLLPAEALLLLLGAGVLVWRWRQPAAFLLLLSGLGVLLSGGLLLDASTIPNFAHWAPAFPVFYLALALPPALLLGALRRARRSLQLAGCALLAVVLGADALANAHAYLVTYPPLVPADHSLEALQGRFIASLRAGTRLRVVGTTWQPLYPDIAAMMGADQQARDLLNPSRELPLVGDRDRDLVFLFYHDQEPLLPAVQDYYPSGHVVPLQTPDGNRIASAYRVPAATAWRGYGVGLTLGGSAPAGSAAPQGTPAWTGQVPEVGALPAGVPLRYPVEATWSGALYLPAAEAIHARVEGGEAAQIWLAGQAVTPETARSVEGGWMRFQVQVWLQSAAFVRFLIQEGGGAFAAPDTAHLWPIPANQGLAATLAGGSTTQRIDPFVSARHWSTAGGTDPDGLGLVLLPGAVNAARWEGEVRTETGDYTMILHAGGQTQLTLDGHVIINQCTPFPPLDADPTVNAPIHLQAGWHPVRLDVQAPPGYYGIEWRWTRPDGVEETVPPAALRWSAQAIPGAPVPWPAAPPPITCP